MTFDALGLAEPLLRVLSDTGYTNPTPIQEQSIPPQLDGRDVLGVAQTGTGKTAAFTLPILHRLCQPGAPRRAKKRPHVLILAPTRELSIQIGDSIKAYGTYMGVSHFVVVGGVGQMPQVKALARGVDILVATPGRLLDLVAQGHVMLDQVTDFVLDEADRMLDMGFIRDVRRILGHLPAERRSLMFSATMPNEIQKLAADFLSDPVRVEVTPGVVTVDRIEQHVIYGDQKAKRDLLLALLEDEAMERVIVFTRTKHRANRVAQWLEGGGIAADAIHGNKSQSARQTALNRFKAGEARVLVATDIAARGIDVDGVTHVVNFELPNEPESYVHRIGRTARAGADGIAISLCDATEVAYLRDIEKIVGRQIPTMGETERPEPAPAANRKKHSRPKPPTAKAANGNERRRDGGDERRSDRKAGRVAAGAGEGERQRPRRKKPGGRNAAPANAAGSASAASASVKPASVAPASDARQQPKRDSKPKGPRNGQRRRDDRPKSADGMEGLKRRPSQPGRRRRRRPAAA